MSDELEQSVNSDVLSESSAPSESASLEKGPEVNPELSSSPESKPEQEKYVPYDRFKELVDQKNEFSRRQEQAEKQLRDFQERFDRLSKGNQELSPEAKIIERLKGIDPEFGKLMEQQQAKLAKLDQLEQWKAQAEAQSQQSQAQSMLDKLQGEMKVDPYLHQRYVDSIRVAAQANPNLQMQDLPKLYKQYHSEMNKFLEGQKRSALAEYSSSKKTASTVTSSPKSTPVKSGPIKGPSTNPTDAFEQLKADIKKEYRKSKDL